MEKMLEEELKNKIWQRYFKKFDCSEIIKRIDFAVKNDFGYLLWAEAKQQPTDIYRMLTQLLLTIKQDAYDLQPPKFLGCFDNEKISFIEYYDILSVYNLNDFNWTQTPSQADDKTVEIIKKLVNRDKVFTFFYDGDDSELENFIAQNFTDGGSLLSTLIDKNNFIFVYQKWRKMVMPSINADWDKLKKKYAVYDRDFFLAELNIDDNDTPEISDDKTAYPDFYMTFNALNDSPYQLKRKDEMGFDWTINFKFKSGGLEKYAEFWKRYKRPPKNIYWHYIIERLDLLVSQDVRERKGAFFTPQVCVEKSQEYLADELGKNWQENYYIWDCCAGTGNLLNGLHNEYNVFASTLDRQDVDVMQERIKNGANLLESHVFQFDFLNDDFSEEKLPSDLYKIISDTEKRKRLVIYINPPYAEADNRIGVGRKDIAVTKIAQKYENIMRYTKRELFIQFLTRIYMEIPGCIIGHFSTLKVLQAPRFSVFRNYFTPLLCKCFLFPANIFDNVSGQFPIGFFIWNLSKKQVFNKIKADIFDKNGEKICDKVLVSYDGKEFINDWVKTFKDTKNQSIATIIAVGSDFQNQQLCRIEKPNMKVPADNHNWQITAGNLIESSIYFAVRYSHEHTWINHYDQFFFPKSGWKKDKEFQINCLVWTLFNPKNRISCEQCVNHWIPFTEREVKSKSLFDSHFMSDFLAGKIKPQKQINGLFLTAENIDNTDLIFSSEAKAVLENGKELWCYYHTMEDANPNASLYDIKLYFQGRNEKGNMKPSSDDVVYTRLLNELKDSLLLLREQIKPKVYEYGFLKQ